MIRFTDSQLKLLGDFFGNFAVLWFGAAFINVPQTILGIQSFSTGLLSLIIGMMVVKEVK